MAGNTAVVATAATVVTMAAKEATAQEMAISSLREQQKLQRQAVGNNSPGVRAAATEAAGRSYEEALAALAATAATAAAGVVVLEAAVVATTRAAVLSLRKL